MMQTSDIESILQQPIKAPWKNDVDNLVMKFAQSDADELAEIVLQTADHADDVRVRYFTLKAQEMVIRSRVLNAAVGTGLSRYCRDCVAFCDRYGRDEFDLQRQYDFSKKFLSTSKEQTDVIKTCRDIYPPFNPIIDEILNGMEQRGEAINE